MGYVIGNIDISLKYLLRANQYAISHSELNENSCAIKFIVVIKRWVYKKKKNEFDENEISFRTKTIQS